MATAYSVKAKTDTENAALFNIVNSLEEEKVSMTQRMMKVLSENIELHNASRLRGAMPNASNPDMRDQPKAASNPSEFYHIGCDAGEEEQDWDEQAYEDDEWCYAPAPTRSTKVDAPGLTTTQTVTRTRMAPDFASGSRDGDATNANSRPSRPPTPNGGRGGDGVNDGGGSFPFGNGGRPDDGPRKAVSYTHLTLPTNREV